MVGGAFIIRWINEPVPEYWRIRHEAEDEMWKREEAAIIIQQYVTQWLWSAPNGPMFKKRNKKLQVANYLR